MIGFACVAWVLVTRCALKLACASTVRPHWRDATASVKHCELSHELLCILAGNDLNEDITPIEAGLKWTIGKNRRETCDFLGGEVGTLRCHVAHYWSQALLIAEFDGTGDQEADG